MRAVASTRRLLTAMTLIVATALAACGGDANAATDPDGGSHGNGGNGSAFPTELVGTWV